MKSLSNFLCLFILTIKYKTIESKSITNENEGSLMQVDQQKYGISACLMVKEKKILKVEECPGGNVEIEVNICVGFCPSYTLPTNPLLYCFSRCIADGYEDVKLSCGGKDIMTYQVIKSCKCSKKRCREL